jgi:hypothetical protein
MHPLVTPYQLMVAVLAVVLMIVVETVMVVVHVVAEMRVQSVLALNSTRRLSVSAV